MGIIQKDALRTMIITYFGLALGYLNKGLLFVLILSPQEIGLVNLILSVGLLFAQFSNLGAINAIAKFLPFFRDSDNQKQGFLLFNLFFVVGGILFFTAIVLLLQSQIVHFYTAKSPLFVDYYFWIIPIGIANVFFLVFESYLKAIFNNILSTFLYEVVLRICVTILLLLLGIDLIDFKLFFIFHCLIYFIPSVILMLYLFKTQELSFNRTTFKLSKKFKNIIFSFSLFSYSNTLGAMIVMTLDSLMIAYYLGMSETGVYTTIIFLTSALQIPYKSLIRISSPFVPQFWKERNLDKMQDLYRKVSSISLITGLYAFLVVWLNREELFSFLPKEYLPGIWVFLFLMIGRIFDMYTGLNAVIFVTSKKYKYDLFFAIGLILVVFILNIFLIPTYGVVGAAISTGIALVLYNFGRLLFVYFVYKIHPFSKNQVIVMGLFTVSLVLVELLPSFSDIRLLQITIIGIISTGLFIGSTLLLNLEPELTAYLQNVKKFILKK